VELAKEEVSALSQRAGCRKNISGVPAGRNVFLLTSPFIGLTENSRLQKHKSGQLKRIGAAQKKDGESQGGEKIDLFLLGRAAYSLERIVDPS
jgi:hypothetical protein